jgi:hypothetical protein
VFRYFKQTLNLYKTFYQEKIDTLEREVSDKSYQIYNLDKDLNWSKTKIQWQKDELDAIQNKHSATKSNLKMEYGFIEPIRLRNTFEIGSYIVNNRKDPDEFLRDCIRQKVSSQIYDQLEANPGLMHVKRMQGSRPTMDTEVYEVSLFLCEMPTWFNK